MALKVRIKKKKKAEEKVEEKERELPKFKKKREWIMLIEYRPELRREDLTYQKIVFKADGGFKEVWKEAEKICDLLGKGLTKTLHEIQNVKMSRVVGLYAKNAFKDWEKAVGSESSNKHVKDAVKFSKELEQKKIKPKSFVNKVKVR